MNIVALSLGSNLGDRGANIKKAVKLLEKEFSNVSKHSVKFKKSNMYETLPLYLDDIEQEKYYNCCVCFEAELPPKEIFKITNKIEKEMGRKRLLPNASRIIDIDILFVGDNIVAEDNLIIPHTEIQDRLFVLKPLSDIMKDFTHPIIQLTVDDLLYECSDKSEIKKVEEF